MLEFATKRFHVHVHEQEHGYDRGQKVRKLELVGSYDRLRAY